MNTKKIEERISKAKTSLILNHPFVGTIALSMPIEITKDIPTAAVSTEKMMFNPCYVERLNDNELLFLVAHECFHVVLEHNFRRKGRNAYKWNKACDYVVNELLNEERIGNMPSGGLLHRDIYNNGGGTAEGIYAILPDENNQPGKNNQYYGAPGEPFDECIDVGENNAKRIELKIKISQAAQAAKMAGKLSAGLNRIIERILKPKANWKELLYNYLIKTKTEERSYSRFNRRFICQNLYLPSQNGDGCGDLVVAVDCSGSIDNDLLAQFTAEINKIKEDLAPQKLHIIYFDSAVTKIDTFEQHEEVYISPVGGGGTDYAPVFKTIEENKYNPVAIVFLTDLWCYNFGKQPEYPVLWVNINNIGGNNKVPFGEVVNIK